MKRFLKYIPQLLTLGLLVALLWAGCAGPRATVSTHELPTPTAPEDVRNVLQGRGDWTERTLARLTLEEKVAQMIVPRAFGYYLNEQEDDWRRLVHLVKDRKIGGLALFQGDVYASVMALNRLQEMADVPLLVSADFERGLPMRTRRGTPFPEAMALAATRNTDLAYKMGRAVAEEGRAIGVHQNYAPVVDVNINPDNPVINTRSFGEDPLWVGDMAGAFARGLQEGGMIATAKHFPGHGDTGTDSHLGLPNLTVGRGRLDSVEFAPFQRLINNGIMAVMIGHLAVPALEPKRGIPATMSKTIVTNLLKDTLGFGGLVVSDAMEMHALLNNFGLQEAVVRSVEAGIDLVIVPPLGTEDDALDALVQAARNGRLFGDRIAASVRKIWSVKQWLKLDESRSVDLAQIPQTIGTPDHWDVAQKIARASITLLKNENVLPLQRFGSRKRLLVLTISDNEDYRTEINRSSNYLSNERVGSYFTAQLRKRIPQIESALVDPRSNKMDFDSLLTRIQKADVIVCAVYVKARSGSGKFGLQQKLIDFSNLAAVQGKPVAFVAMGSPYVLGGLKNGALYMCAYSDGELSTEAAVEALCGEISIRGKLPVTIPGMFARGSGIDTAPTELREDLPSSVGFDAAKLLAVDTVVMQAIRDSAFPGAQLLIVKDGAIVCKNSFGKLEYRSDSPRVNTSTMFDLASLTKVVATTAAIMKLYDDGKLALDEKVVRYLSEFGKRGKENITVRNLLLHNSGLPAFKQLYRTCSSATEALDSVFNTELIYRPGDSTVYSDFGFIVLGKVVEKITAVPLDVYVAKTFFEPLGMEKTMFNPPDSVRSNIAPTEIDTVWRKRAVQGTVHDETAALLGGVAGHAGLFSTVSDLAVYAQMLLNGGSYGGNRYFKPETVQLFTQKQNTGGTRMLGWDEKTMNGYSTAGSLFGERSFGHTGFTGTSIWIDPERKIFVILLTNRVYPTRDNHKIRAVRPAIHDAVMRALKDRSSVELLKIQKNSKETTK